MDRTDVGMVQGRGCARLQRETLPFVPVERELIGEKLDGHDAVEAFIPGLVDLAHAPLSDLLEERIM